MEAQTYASALAALRARALFVTSLEDAASVKGAAAALLHVGSAGHTALVSFFRSFATLAHAGVSIRRSLDVTLEQCRDARLAEALSSVVSGIENGLALSEAMSRHPRVFPQVFVTMIRAGELGGTLDVALHRLASTLEKDRAVRKRVGAALTYPIVVAVAAAGLVLFLLTSIVPMFSSMYAQMHVPLPPITTALISIGLALHGGFALPALCALAFALAASGLWLRCSHAASAGLQSVLFSLPIVGSIKKKITLARIARMLGTLLSSGAGLVPSLDVVMDLVAGTPFAQSLTDLQQGLREGSGVSGPLAKSHLFEPMVVQMVSVGEETGSLDAMLLRIADYYDVDVETALTSLGAALEPAMILLLGGAVGVIVSAIFIPLYTLIGSIK